MPNKPFPQEPSITLYDPLAEFLGAGDGHITYRFEDAVKLAGHACPTVAGAFLVAIRALQELYGAQTPRRGDIRIDFSGEADQGGNGPISQVFTLITGAAGDNGFQGLGGRFIRRDLLRFGVDREAGFRFERVDTGQAVLLAYDPAPIPPDPQMLPLLQAIQQGVGDEGVKQDFRELWRDRVLRILDDGGQRTVSLLPNQ